MKPTVTTPATAARTFRPLAPAAAGALAAALLVAAPALRAQSVSTWNGGTGNWSGAGLWTPNGVPNAAGADARVDGGKTGTISAVSVDGSYTVGRLSVDTGDRVSLNAGQIFTLTDAGGFAGSGTLVNNGAFTVNSGDIATNLTISGNVTFSGTGTLAVQSGTRVNGSGTLTNAAGHTIQGETSGGATIGNDQMGIVNSGLIHANVSGRTLIIDPGNVVLPVSPTTNGFLNASTGTVRASGGGTASLINTGGAAGGTFTNNGLFVASGNGSTLSVPAAALTNVSGNTLTGGTFTAAGNAAATPAVVDLSGAAITINNGANLKLIGPGASIPAISGLAINRGTFAIDGNRTFATAGAFSNEGTLGVAAGSTFAVNGAFTLPGPGILFGAGTVVATGAAQTLAGAIYPGGFTLSDSAVGLTEFSFSPSHPAAALTLQGASVAFSPGTVVFLTLGAPAGPGNVGADNDHLFVQGAFTLDGTLNLSARAGFGPGTYDLIDYAGGPFTDNVLNLGSLPAGFSYALDLSMAGQVNLVVTAVPEPGTWALLLLGGAGLLLGFRRRARGMV